MSVDVDAVNERLNGLVTLLKAVGVDSETARNASNNKNGAAADMVRQLNDEQIEAIIKKLQQAQTEAPQIIAALEAHAEARSLTGDAADKKHQSKYEEEVVEEVIEEQTEVEEEDDDDDFDEDANYPMVGHGVSDDISVVSDLTTPTVVNHSSVPEEEHYRDTLPPMIIGGVGEPSMVILAPKRKNLVSQVRPPPVGMLGAGAARGRNVIPSGPPMHIGPPVVAPTAGGAAAARRKMYLDTMAKLQENPNGLAYVGPSAAPSKTTKGSLMTTPSSKSSGGINKSGSSDSAPLKGKKKVSNRKGTSSSSNSNNSHTTSNTPDWGSFEDPKKSSKGGASSSGQTVIDDDGFLVGDCNFDPFAVASNPFKTSSGELEFGDSSAATNFMLSDSSAPGGFASFDAPPISSGFGSPNHSSKKAKPKARRSSTVASSTSGGDHGHRTNPQQGEGGAPRPRTRPAAASGAAGAATGAGRQRRGRRMSVS